jgi:hypothetical protein
MRKTPVAYVVVVLEPDVPGKPFTVFPTVAGVVFDRMIAAAMPTATVITIKGVYPPKYWAFCTPAALAGGSGAFMSAASKLVAYIEAARLAAIRTRIIFHPFFVLC